MSYIDYCGYILYKEDLSTTSNDNNEIIEMNIEGIHTNTYSTYDDNDNNEVLSNGDGYDDCDIDTVDYDYDDDADGEEMITTTMALSYW